MSGRLLLTLLIPLMMAACSSPQRPDSGQVAADIEAIAAEVPDATIAVAVRDPSTGVDYNRNADRLYHAASTMKVPVMIELFRQSDQGRFSLDDSLLVQNEFQSIVDGSTYAIGDDSDDALYDRLGSNMSIRDLMDRMIVVSSNLATNLLIGFVNADSVQATTERLGTTDMRTLRGVEDLKAFEQGLSNRTTARDLAILLEALLQGEAVSPEADRAMIEIMQGQEFNEMIPARLPQGVNVAHKTGQITEIHHDAGIVLGPDIEPYVIVILIEGIADDSESAQIGSRISRAVYDQLRPAVD